MKSNTVKKMKTISCGTLTYKIGKFWNDTQILLIKQFNNTDGWGIPKGHVNFGETYEECAIRETREETGIIVSLEERLPNVSIRRKNFDKIVITYLARQICNNVPFANSVESEVVDAKWFGVENLPQLYSYQQELIMSAIDKIKVIYENQK